MNFGNSGLVSTMECSMRRKRKEFNLNRMFIAQMRRIFWFYYRPKCLKYHRCDCNEYPKPHWHCNMPHFTSLLTVAKECQVDHKEPVEDTETTEQSWDVYRERLFVKPEQTQILCKPCHKIKTQAENKWRRERRKKKNEF